MSVIEQQVYGNHDRKNGLYRSRLVRRNTVIRTYIIFFCLNLSLSESVPIHCIIFIFYKPVTISKITK